MKNSPGLAPSAEKKEIQKVRNSTNTEYYKGQAFIAYKKGWKDLGLDFLQKALEKANQEGKVISIQEINDIMEGNVPSSNPKDENGSGSKEIQDHGPEVQPNTGTMLEPLKEEFIKLVQDIAKKIRQELMVHNYPCLSS